MPSVLPARRERSQETVRHAERDREVQTAPDVRKDRREAVPSAGEDRPALKEVQETSARDPRDPEATGVIPAGTIWALL